MKHSSNDHPGVLIQDPAARFQALFDHFTVGLAEVDPGGRIVIANPALCQALGYPHEGLTGKAFIELVHPDDAEMAAGRIDLTDAFAFQVRLRRWDGEPVWFFLSATPLRDPSGDVRSSAIACIDITRRKQIEDKYRESEARYRTLFDSIDQGLLILDMIFDEDCTAVDFRFVEVNETFGFMTTQPDVVGKRVREVAPDLDPRWFEVYGTVARTGEPVRFQQQVSARDRWYDVFAFRITWNDKHHVAVLCKDITEQRESDEALSFQAHLLDTVEQAVIATDPDGLITYWNRYSETLFGWPAEDVIGKPSTDMLVSEEDVSRAEAIWEGFQRGESWSGEIRAKRRNGESFWAYGALTPAYGPDGDLIAAIGIAMDVTERRQTEDALKFQARLLDTVQQSVIATDPEGIVTYWNKVAEQRFGVPAEEAIGRRSVDITVGEDGLPEAQAREIREALQRRESWFGELFGRGNTGEPYWSHAAVAPVENEQGELVGIIGTSLDVTERVLAEEALRRSESRLRAVLTALPVGVWITDADRQLIEVNPQADLIWAGESSSSDSPTTRGRYLCWDPVTDELVPHDDQPLGRALATGEPVIGVELKIGRFDGTIGTVLASAAPILGPDGEVIGGVSVAQDITELKQASAALRKSEERHAFLLELSDTLRPLSEPAEIQGQASWLLGEFLDVDRVSYAEIEGDSFTVRRGYARDVPLADGGSSFKLLGQRFMAAHERNEAVAVDDVAADPRFTEQECATLEAAGIAAFAGTLVAKEGQAVGALSVEHASRREWTAAELELMREVAERVWSDSERARVEIALRESEARFRSVADLSPDGLLIYLDGSFVYANASAARIFGVDDPAEIVGQEIFDIAPPTDHARIRRRIRQVLNGKMAPPNEMELIRPDGSHAFVDVSAGPVIWNGEPAIEVIWRDASERRAAETTLRESEARFHAIANLVPDLIWRSDRHGNREWFNQRWFEYSGQTAEVAQGTGWLDIIHPEDRQETWEQYRRAVATGQAFRREHRMRRHDGEYHWFLIHAEPVRDDSGAVAAWFGTATDVHEQRIARDALEERVAETTRELRALSRQLFRTQEMERRHVARELHDEIGQELTGLSLALAAARRGHAEPKLEYITEIVDDLLGKVRKLSLDLRPSALDDLGLLPAVLIHTEHFGAQTGIAVNVRHHGMDRRFPTDVETAAYRVVQEALTNIARHADAPAATVHLVAETSLLVMIRDQGRGFDPEDALAAGTSSGLTGMRERITLIGGEFSIESSPGAGAVVVAEIPLSGYSIDDFSLSLIREGEPA